ncbi:MAG: class II aldolase/adducin family protein [Pseudomonadota bacterium]
MTSVKHKRLRQDVIKACLTLNATGLNQGTAGNVSVRQGKGFLITPSGLAYETMTPEQVVSMDLDCGYRGDWKPSSEWRMHTAIYRERPKAGAVVHVHSPYATALSCLRRDIPAFHYMIGVAGGKSIRCADYATMATEELSTAMMAALEDRSACLLANHGMVCFGPTLDKALWLAGEVEALCRQYWIASQVGEPVILDDAEMDRILEVFRTYGRQDASFSKGPIRRDS